MNMNITNFKKLNFVEKLLFILMATLTIFWGLIIYLQVGAYIDDYGDFSIVYNYGVISLTLFGITLLGGIFEKRHLERIERELFKSSIYFLVTFVSFFFIYTLSILSMYQFAESIQYIIIIPFFVALLTAVFMLPLGIIHLLFILLTYRLLIREEKIH